jgi:hypothetical protein
MWVSEESNFVQRGKEMGGTCSEYGEEMCTGFGEKTWKETTCKT